MTSEQKKTKALIVEIATMLGYKDMLAPHLEELEKEIAKISNLKDINQEALKILSSDDGLTPGKKITTVVRTVADMLPGSGTQKAAIKGAIVAKVSSMGVKDMIRKTTVLQDIIDKCQEILK